MFKEIDRYAIQFNTRKKQGKAVLHLVGGGYFMLRVADDGELHAVADLLRNEKPVFVHTNSGLLSTSWEPTGEGES